MTTTPFAYKCEILGELFTHPHSDFAEFQKDNDVAVSLAFGISEGYVLSQETVIPIIEDGWNNWLELTNLQDKGYSTLEEMLVDSKWYEGWSWMVEPEEETDDTI